MLGSRVTRGAHRAASLVGRLGYDLNYTQGMDFDYETGTLYAALYTDEAGAMFASINLGTGKAKSIQYVDNREWEIAINNGVPEPATYMLLAGGLLCVGFLRRRN